MGTIIYSPGVRAVIYASASKQYVDISNDIASGNVTLNQTAPHSVSLNIANKTGKYSGLFVPNDRIAVMLKRTRWLKVFTGYLNEVPYLMVYPKNITITATCTLKRLQFHFWDPHWQQAVTWIIKHVIPTGTGVDMRKLIKTMLVQIAGWDATKIHIGGFPPKWSTQLLSLWASLQSKLQVPSQGITIAGQTFSGVTVFTFTYLANLWIDNGGPSQWAWLMAGIALAESAGEPKIVQKGQPYADTGWGLWQITPGNSVPTVGINTALLTPTKNAKAALIKFKGQGVTAWPDPIGRAWMSAGRPTSPSRTLVLTWLSQNGISTNAGANKPTTSTITANAALHEGGGLSKTVTTKVPKQSPNAALAVQTAEQQIGKPYVWGGETPNVGFDCSGLTQYSWRKAGQTIGRRSETQYANAKIWLVPITQALPGDLLFAYTGDNTAPPSHVAMYVGTKKIVEAPHTTAPVHSMPLSTWLTAMSTGRSYFMGAGRVTTQDGPAKTGAAAPTTIKSLKSKTTGGSPVLNARWTPALSISTSTPMATSFTGLRVLMQSTPFMPYMQNCVAASLRHFCSAPNGDFIAWFPDYFGQYGETAAWDLSLTELIDDNIRWTDQTLVTHQYAAGALVGPYGGLTPSSGGNVTVMGMLTSLGIATIDIPTILRVLFGITTNKIKRGPYSNVPTSIYQQFGPRPNTQMTPTILADSKAAFWMALQYFRKNWVSQFPAQLTLTFMPELYPGMLLRLKEVNLQMYVAQVNHSFTLSEGGGFFTSVNTVAPSDLQGGGLVGLAVAGPLT